MGKVILFCIVIMNLSIFGTSIYRSCVRIENLKEELKLIEENKIELNEKIQEYDNLLNQLKDPFYREKIARDRLQMKKEGEVIYRSIDIKQEEK
ncbi:FtsB family cell division protein [Cetobacterium sp. SF1]|uniref:FtsB family cell division protein n=1 Tax=unclassified Cetobacterium TaxID=2630983 RepID=UPI003CF7CA70